MKYIYIILKKNNLVQGIPLKITDKFFLRLTKPRKAPADTALPSIETWNLLCYCIL